MKAHKLIKVQLEPKNTDKMECYSNPHNSVIEALWVTAVHLMKLYAVAMQTVSGHVNTTLLYRAKYNL